MAGAQSDAIQNGIVLALPAVSSPPRTPSPQAAADVPMKVALLSNFASVETPPELPAKIIHWSGAGDTSETASPQPPGLERSITAPADSGLSAWLVPPPGLPDPVGTPSRGSSLHSTGTCKPCAWFWKPKGCQNGKDCLHCHLCPDGEIKARKKSKLAMMRLGLATPKAMMMHSSQDVGIHPAALSFGLPDLSADSASELESTTYSSFEQGSFASTGSKPSEFFSGAGSRGESASSSECDRQASAQEEATSCNSDSALALPGGGPSVATFFNHGSVLHADGKCRPCAWFWKPSGCKNGWDCSYCHICSEGELKARKKSKEAFMRTEAYMPQWSGLVPQEIPYIPNLSAWH